MIISLIVNSKHLQHNDSLIPKSVFTIPPGDRRMPLKDPMKDKIIPLLLYEGLIAQNYAQRNYLPTPILAIATFVVRIH